MFSHSWTICFGVIFFTVVKGFPFAFPRDSTTIPGTIKFPLRSRDSTGLVKRDLPSAPLHNAISLYSIDLYVGTPAQKLTVQLDTGSSDTFFFAKSLCGASCPGGGFDPTLSSTAALRTDLGPFSESYMSGYRVSGVFLVDNIRIGSTFVNAVTFGYATASNMFSFPGIMGVGFEVLEAGTKKFPTLVDDMVLQGLINIPSYSIYLDDIKASTGAILFGGTDHSKYSGNLVSIPFVASPDGAPRFTVQWTGLSITSGSTVYEVPLVGSTNPLITNLDTGTTFTRIPDYIFQDFVKGFNAQPVSSEPGLYSIPCNLGNGFVSFEFAKSVTINVPFSELAVPWTVGGSNICVLGFVSQGTDKFSVFGDTFLRSAYLHFNLNNGTVGMAQAIWT